MNKTLLILIFASLLFLQCKSDENTSETTTSAKTEKVASNEKEDTVKYTKEQLMSPWLATRVNKESKNQEDKLNANNLDKMPTTKDGQSVLPSRQGIPKISSIVSAERVSQLVEVEVDKIKIKEVLNKKNPGKLRSCFYKWVEAGNEDAGLFIQIQSNPIGEELPNWAEKYMESKYQSGEMSYPSDGKKYKYTKINNLGIEGAFCHELGKVIWRPDNDHIVSVVDNYKVSDKKRINTAKAISQIINPQLELLKQ